MIWRIAATVAVAFMATMVLAPGVASAGGFSTVELESPPPEDLQAGQAWEARFTVLAHGRMPMTHAEPVVRIERTDGGPVRTIEAAATSRPGTYRARVAFPKEGRWEIGIAEYEQSIAAHEFGTVRVGPQAAMATSDGSRGGLGSLAALAIALGLGLLAGGAAWLAQRNTAPRSAAEPG